jgi:hypothetical protein
VRSSGEGRDNGGSGGRSGREGQTVLGALQSSNGSLKGVAGRVSRAGVVVSLLLTDQVLGGLVVSTKVQTSVRLKVKPRARIEEVSFRRGSHFERKDKVVLPRSCCITPQHPRKIGDEINKTLASQIVHPWSFDVATHIHGPVKRVL